MKNNTCEFCGTEEKLIGEALCDGCNKHLYIEDVRYDLEEEWNELLKREGDRI